MTKTCIYRITNTENGKNYLGQTRDWTKRERAYRSCPFNPKSNEYTRPIMAAIRKYGLDKFIFRIEQEFPEDVSQDILDKAEEDAIVFYESLITQNGYNIQSGGQNYKKVPLTYEQRIKKAKLFSGEEIKDIQEMLIKGTPFPQIYQKYPGLKQTFLSNINTGVNFHNSDFSYPLDKNPKRSLSEDDLDKLRKEIIRGDKYQDIADKWGFKSIGFISQINTGKAYYSDKYVYPLCQKTKGIGEVHQKKALLVKHFLIHTNLSAKEIQIKVGYKSSDPIKKINEGKTHFDENLLYPLKMHQKENSSLFKINDVSTIPD